MAFIADLHVHSKFSRATAKNLDLEHLFMAAQMKGIAVVGTGDFTHPAWLQEIDEKLIEDGSGLLRLRPELAAACERQIPPACRRQVHFMLTCEISNIYKKEGITRKSHHLVLLPDLEAVRAFNRRLGTIGNLQSDGRPILGLDARDLLEMVQETPRNGYLIPAHIWTPWFSVLGSKSGFDSIDACFDDLSEHIFAVETGLSSDPAMNWRVSWLDRMTLVSNSDAHSPPKLGREANRLETEMSFSAIRSAFEHGSRDHFLGTLEFYPEEGKYHLDGHRRCGIRYWPEQTRENDGRCPVCGKPLTLGVLNRVEALADRREGFRPPGGSPFASLIPLTDILAEILGVGQGTQTVRRTLQKTLRLLGPELGILEELDPETIAESGVPLLSEAVMRMRSGKVDIQPGFDGEFGKVRLFKPRELRSCGRQKPLFVGRPAPAEGSAAGRRSDSPARVANGLASGPTGDGKKAALQPILPLATRTLNPEQRQVVKHDEGPLLIVAGPGTGKTYTVAMRIVALILERGVPADGILAVTFTGKAAREMAQRIGRRMGFQAVSVPWVGTFHALCYEILCRQAGQRADAVLDEKGRRVYVRDAVERVRGAAGSKNIRPEVASEAILMAKQNLLRPDDDLSGLVPFQTHGVLAEVYRIYRELLNQQGIWDFEDLVMEALRLLEDDAQLLARYRDRFRYIFVDEYQDINYGQYRLLRQLAPADHNLCAIGDPDQAIYGFRGSDVRYFDDFVKDYPRARVIRLSRNYRSTETILEASSQVVGAAPHAARSTSARRVYSDIQGVRRITVLENTTQRSEAVTVGRIIEELVGGLALHAIDAGRVHGGDGEPERGFADFAVLYRTRQQAGVFREVFAKAGIPCQSSDREWLLQVKGITEALSLLRVIGGGGSFADLETIAPVLPASLSRETLGLFKAWSYHRRFGFQQALDQARRFPVEGMSTARQRRLHAHLNQLRELRRRTGSLSVEGRLKHLYDHTRLGGRIASDRHGRKAWEKLLEMAQGCRACRADFVRELSMGSDTDLYEDRSQKVALMTMHAAKGLEFPVVFIAGCERGLIPFDHPGRRDTDLDEERRLFYVAMTRARDQLFLSWSHKRSLFGRKSSRRLSPFVEAVEARLREHVNKSLPAGKRRRERQLSLF